MMSERVCQALTFPILPYFHWNAIARCIQVSYPTEDTGKGERLGPKENRKRSEEEKGEEGAASNAKTAPTYAFFRDTKYNLTLIQSKLLPSKSILNIE